MMRKVGILLILVLLLIGCEDESILGKWNPEGIESEVPTMVITEDSIIIMEIPIPYEVDGNTIYINDSEGRKSIEFTISGNSLTFKQGEISETYIRIED